MQQGTSFCIIIRREYLNGDEPTANVDPENERDLVDAIEALTKEKTIIMIAHRLKTVRHADQILVVDKGKIAQRGTHDMLMQEDGIYRRFCAIKTNGSQLEVVKTMEAKGDTLSCLDGQNVAFLLLLGL